MDNLITVVSLQGKAWAVAQDGSRRELQVGDTVAADEMVVTAAGAQIDLQFADNQVLTLVGEQDAPVDVAQLAKEAELSQPLTPINSAKEDTSSAITVGDTLESEGHRFVQLVRIHEIIESDGFTPLTVARIQEIIKPLGMVLPERDFEDDRWKEHVSYREHGSNVQYSVSIAIDVIADDDIINAAEAQRDITVTGTVGGDVKPGDKVTVTVNGKTYETTVNADGKTWNVDIPGSELVQDKTVEATVTGNTPTGETITADTERPYGVLTELPKVDVELEGAGDDGVYNESEIVNGKVPAKITLDPNTVKEGDILKVTTPNGDVLLERPVTQEDINNGVPIEVPVAPRDKTVIVEATITNPEGNTGADRDEKPVDNITPTLKVELEGYGDDGIYNETEITNGKVPGTVTLNPETVKEGDILKVTTPNGDVLLERPVTQDDINNGVPVEVPVAPGDKTVTVEATITDPAGNSSSSSDTKPVDNLPPELVGSLNPQNDADADDITLDLSKEFNDAFSGKDLTYQATDLPTGLKIDPKTGIISGKIDSSASQGGNAGTKGDYKVTITVTDLAGNSSEHNFNWTVTNPDPTASDDTGATDEDTSLVVAAKDGVLQNDNDPDGDQLYVTGIVAGETKPAAPGGLNTEIKGKYGTLTLQEDGSYVYTPNKDNPEVRALKDGESLEDTFSYTMTDREGGEDDAVLRITINGVTDSEPTITPEDHNNPDDPTDPLTAGHATVYESGLVAGGPAGQSKTAAGEITVDAKDGLVSVTVGTETLDLDALAALSSATPVTITTDYGVLTLIGFTPEVVNGITVGGKLSYSYELTKPFANAEPGQAGDENGLDKIDLKVVDAGKTESSGTLDINIIDDVPVARDDANSITEDTTVPATGNVFGSKNASAGDVEDTQGADGSTVTGVQAGAVAADEHVADGNLTVAIPGKYGTLTLNADGTYSYELDSANLAVQGLSAGETLNDEVFSYTITDSDGDQSTATLTITINGSNDGVTVDVPIDHDVPVDSDGKPTNYTKTDDHVVFESGLADGSKPDAEATKVVSSFTLKALDGLAESDAVTITYNGGELTLSKAEVEALGATPKTINTPYGELILNGYSQDTDPSSATFGTITIDYNYTLNTAPTVPGDATNDVFGIVVKDKDTDQDAGTISIKIMDDAPNAENDKNKVTEGDGIDDVSSIATGNVIGTGGTSDPSSGDVADTTGADGAIVTGVKQGATTGVADASGDLVIEGEYGTLTINPDGSYSYVLDNSNLAVQGLIVGEDLTETFNYTITDGDGDSSSADLVITINGANDGVTVTVPDPTDPTDPNYPIEDPSDPTLPTWGTINDHVVFESGLVGGSQNDTASQIDGLVKVESNFTLSALDGLDDSTAITFAVTGKADSVLSKADVEALSTTPQTISTEYGDLVLNGYTLNADGTITIDYEYTLTSAPDNSSGNGESIDDTIKITVNDRDTDSATQDLVIRIMDDVPLATDDANSITEDEVSVAGNVMGGTGAAAGDVADTQGADGADVSGITSINAPTHVATDTAGVLEIEGQYGTLTINPDGSYSYVLDNSNLAVQGLIVGEDLTETFNYTITDGDGDSSSADLVITINGANDGVTVTVPDPTDPTDPNYPIEDPSDPTLPTWGTINDHVVFESGLVGGSQNDTASQIDGLVKVESNFTLSALDGLDDSTAITFAVTGKADSVLSKADVEALSTTPQTISTEYGDLVLNGYTLNADGTITIDYEYTLTSAPDNSSGNGESIDDTIKITVNDRDTDSATQDLVIRIMDDVPLATDDANSITEDEVSVAGNVMGGTGAAAGDVADTQGADGADVSGITSTNAPTHVATDTAGVLEIEGQYGTLTINPDGSYSYVLDNSNLAVQGLIVGEDLTETFNYTITDGDGDSSSADLVITINGANDGVTVTVPDPTDPTDPNYPIEDPSDPTLPTWGTINDHVVFESGLVGGSQNDTASQIDGLVKVESNFTLSALDGLDDSTAITFAVTGKADSVLSKADVEALSTTPQTISTEYGDLVLNGYTLNADGSITIDYDYTLTRAPINDNSAGEDTFTSDTISITVNDRDTDTKTEDLVIRIMDDVPQAFDDANSVTEDAPDPISGNVITDVNADGEADHVGADGAKVSAIISNNVVGNTAAEVAGDLVIEGEYGRLTINPDGSYTYELDNTNPAVNALKTGDTLTENFTYTLTDADLDADDAKLVITINGRTDGNPTIVPEDKNGADPSDLLTAGQVTVYESGLTTDGPGGQSKTAAGEITVQALDGLVSVSVAGQTFALDALASLSTTNVAINTDYGILTLNGFTPVLVDGIIVGGELTYSYELTKPFNNTEPGEEGDQNGLDTLDLKVVDAGNAESTGSLIINIIDDEPSIGTPEDNTVHESGLPGGSSEGVAVVAVTGDLQVRVGADSTAGGGSPASVRFAEVQDQTALADLNLSSGYNAANEPIPVNYIVSADGLTLTAFKGSEQTDKVFTVTITNPGSSAAGYEFTLHKPLNHGTLESLELPFGFSVIDGDKDPDNSSFTITITDDAPSDSYVLNIVEDSLSTTAENTFNTSADANSTNTVISVTGSVVLDVIDDGEGGKTYSYPDTHTGPQDFYGSVTVNADGSITYVPDSNYSNPSSEDTFTYTTTNGADISVVPVVVQVKPVADAPDLEDDKVLETPEDTPISLALEVPLVTDNTQTEGATSTDYPERLGEITVSFSPTSGTDYGSGTDAFNDFTNGIKLLNGANELTPDADGKFHFVIVEGVNADWHITSGLPAAETGNGVYYITEAQYQALTVLPPVDRHENFEVVVSVDSYEVDVNGEPLPGIDPANSTQTIKVDVQAVTDAPELTLNESDLTTTGAISLTVTDASATDNAKITAAINEDTPLNLQSVLLEQLKDFDGSEKYWYDITGLPEGTQVTIGTKTYKAGSDGKVSMPVADYFESNAVNPDPVFTLTPPKDYSNPNNEPIKAVITLNSKDYDADSTVSTATESVSVDLELQIYAVPDNVRLANPDAVEEDSTVAFLGELGLIDTDGSESITQVRITGLPTEGGDWVLYDHDGNEVTVPTGGNADTGGLVLVVGTGAGAGEYTLGQIKQFTVKPPAHSSLDGTMKVYVTTTEDGQYTQSESDESKEWAHELEIKVTPVAEKIGGEYDADGKWIPATEISDTDGDDTADLTMTEGHSYKTAGEEDTWFNLNQEAGFALKDDWSNQDGKNAANGGVDGSAHGSEETFALLTPELIAGDGSQASANGAKFQWTDKNGDTQTVTFGGDPIEVPIEFLDTLQFKAPENFAGMFKIKVQAKTVDYDEDDPSIKVEAISGEAWLENVLIAPKADTSTTSLTARVEGNEDETMPLSIRPKSSDPAEIFDVTVGAVPNGAMLTYGDYVITEEGVFNKSDLGDDGRLKEGSTAIIVEVISVEADGVDKWKVSFEDFDSKKDMTVTAPLDSNVEFELTVSTVTVDKLKIPSDVDINAIDLPTGVHKVDNGDGSFTLVSKSAPENLTIDVAPKGVADPAIVELDKTVSFTEEKTDQNGIKLNELFKTDGLKLKDNDGSETLSFKIGGLPEGFTVEGATFMGDGTWSFGTAEYDAEQVTIHPPQNYNGKFNFDFYTITTENDGDSLTEKHEINVTVTPSPEAGMNLASSGDEDTSFQLEFGVVHNNGDDDEFVSGVWIKVDSIQNGLALNLGTGADAKSLADAANDANNTDVVLDDGYYKISGDAISNIYAKGKANWSGETSFDVRYEITDPGANGLDPVTDAVSKVTNTDEPYTVTINPVTDKVTLDVTEGDDTTLTAAGAVNVKLSVGNEGQDGGDYDGSEVLTRIIVDNVPDGVVLTNTGAHFIGGGQWVIVSDTKKDGGPLTPELKFKVHGSTGLLDKHPITVTVVSEDAGNGQETTASKTITISTNFTDGDPEAPAKINTWEQTTFEPTEDIAFTLNEAIKAEIEDGVTDNGFTVTLTDLPTGTVVEGMQKTTVDGKDVWSATGSGGDTELQALLDSIKVTPPLDWNNNNHPDGFNYNATLTTHVPGGGRAQETVGMKQNVTPETDDATIAITANPVAEGKDLLINIEVSNPSDAPKWTIVDGKLYLQVDSEVDGKLYGSTGDNLLEIETITGVEGINNGDYYVIELGTETSVDLVFKPDSGQEYAKGDVTINAWVQGKETGADNIVTTNQNATTQFQPANSGYVLEITSPEGTENPSSNKAADGSNLIEVEVGGGGLKDTTGTEKIDTILLDNLPNGFLVYVGADAASATEAKMANNAGGEGTNTWLLGDKMPKYIGILPPKNWSGTIEDIKFTVISGEENLTEKAETTVDFNLTATPVANGVTLAPTASFGNEGEIIGLNLNANLKDLHQAGNTDQHVELITLSLKGLGKHASFYIGEDLSMERVEYDSDTDTYTIKGLSQDDVDNLGFIQANSSIDAGGIKVKAQSQEYKLDTNGEADLTEPEGDPSGWTDEQSITTNIVDQYGTTGDDSLLWTGDYINGRGGDDTIQLRFGEDLSISNLTDNLKNIEVLDLSISGGNAIGEVGSGLSISDVLTITDSRNELTIDGDAEDKVYLDSGWSWDNNVTDGYKAYTYTDAGNPANNVTLNIAENISIVID